MAIAEELKKLHDLHARGALTDDEYARAKEAVLDSVIPLAAPDDDLPPLTDGKAGGDAAKTISLRTVTAVSTFLLFVLVFVVVFLPRLEKARDNLDRFREGAQQRRQLQELRQKNLPGR